MSTMELSAARLPSRSIEIIHEVAESYGVPPSVLRSKTGRHTWHDARAEAVWRLRHERKLTLMQIAALFNRDHTTILNYLR